MAMRITPDDMKPTYQIDDERNETRKIDHEDTLDYTPSSEKGGKANAVMTEAHYRMEFERLMPKGTDSVVPQFAKLAEMERQDESKEDRAARREASERAEEERRYQSANSMAQELNRGLGSHSAIDEIRKNGSWEAENGTIYSISDDGKNIVSETRDGDRDIAEIRDIQGFIAVRHEIEREQIAADGTAERMADLMDIGPAGEKTMLDRLYDRGEGAEWNDRSNGIKWTISEDREHVIAEYQEGHERAGERDVAAIDDVRGIVQERHDAVLERRAAGQAAYEAEQANKPAKEAKEPREQTTAEKEALVSFADRVSQFRNGTLGDTFAADMAELSSKADKPEHNRDQIVAELREHKQGHVISQQEDDKTRAYSLDGDVLKEIVGDAKGVELNTYDANDPEKLIDHKRMESTDGPDMSDFLAAAEAESSQGIEHNRDQIVAELREAPESVGFSQQSGDENRHYSLKGDILREIVNDGEKVAWNVYDANDTEKLIDSSELQRSGQAEGPAHFSVEERWSMGEERPPQVSEEQWKAVGEKIVDDMRLENDPDFDEQDSPFYDPEESPTYGKREQKPQGETLDAVTLADDKTAEYVENTRHQISQEPEAEQIANQAHAYASERFDGYGADPEKEQQNVAVGVDIAEIEKETGKKFDFDALRHQGQIEHNGVTYGRSENGISRTKDGETTEHNLYQVMDGHDYATNLEHHQQREQKVDQANQAEQQLEAPSFKKSGQTVDENGPELHEKQERDFNDIAADHERLQSWSSSEGVSYEDHRDQKQAVGIELRESVVDQLREQPEGTAFDHGNTTYLLKGNELLEQTFTHDGGKDWAIWDANDPSKQLDSASKRENDFAEKFGQPTEAVQGQKQQQPAVSSTPEQKPEIGQAAGWNRDQAPAKVDGQDKAEGQGMSKEGVNNALMNRIQMMKGEGEAPAKTGCEWADKHNERKAEKEAKEGPTPDKPDVAKAKASEQSAAVAMTQAKDRELSKGRSV